MTDCSDDRVSRRRYQREQTARAEAESLLEQKSRDLFAANKELSAQSARLEQSVLQRTAELSIALQRAEAASLARSRFVATMSHEIRTPLGGLLGMVDLLRMDETDEGRRELLDCARAAGMGLSRIVNDVLDFSKMEAGVFVFEEEHVDIRALADSIRTMAVSNKKGEGRSIIVKIDHSVPRLFLGDATRIRQVLSNLLDNALRYSQDGPIVLRARGVQRAEDCLLRVEVEDFGVGISESAIPDLFKDFSQISNSLTAAAQGTGLGLAICKRIMEGCGGRIGVESCAETGSTFWFELPVQVINGEDVRDLHTAPEADVANLVGLRVLIAEDNVINQKLLLAYAGRMGLVVELAENGRIALDLFAPEKFDIVLMDVAMPDMDGIEAIRRIRAKWAGADLPPILLLTAHVMDAIEEDAHSVGVETVLSKPISFEDLKAALAKVVAAQPAKPQNTARPVPAALRDAPAHAGPKTIADMLSPAAFNELTEIFGADELVGFVQKYIDDACERLTQIEIAVASGESLIVTQQAHSLKGASHVFGFADIPDWARIIEASDPIEDAAQVIEITRNIRNRLSEVQSLI